MTRNKMHHQQHISVSVYSLIQTKQINKWEQRQDAMFRVLTKMLWNALNVAETFYHWKISKRMRAEY